MEIEKKTSRRMFDIRPTSPTSKSTGGVFSPGRLLLGRSESCDLIVNNEAVSAVHAVLEIFEDRAVLYDMNSTNGTYVNDEKIVVKEVHVGDFFRLADAEFEYHAYKPEEALPPVLDTLEPMKGSASTRQPPEVPELNRALPKEAPSVSTSVPSIVYPLAADPKAEFSEYIFEDKDDLYPIFRYEASRQAVEVIILFKDSVFSIDYLPEGRSTYYISGVQKEASDLEFPYFPKGQKFPFVEVRGPQATVHTLPGFDVLVLSDTKKSTGHVGMNVEISGQDLVRFQKDDVQIFVRSVLAPPSILSAPILKRDPDFRKYLFLFMFGVFIMSVGMNVIDLPEDKTKTELAPERLATILNKERLTITKPAAPKVDMPKVEPGPTQKVAVRPDAPDIKAPDVDKPDVVTTKDQSKLPDPGKRTAPEKKVVKQGTERITDPGKMAKPPGDENKPLGAASGAGSKGAPAFSPTNSNAQGNVEVYKSADFSSTVSSLVAKGGSLTGINTRGTGGGNGTGTEVTGATTGLATGSGTVKTQGMATNQGSLVGATVGVLGESKGSEGLSSKKAIYTAGIPADTIVLGSMDPDIIRRILLDHLPQFRFCYQRELEKAASDLSGVIKLVFTIGASGHVSQAGIDGSSTLPTEVKKCVVDVLRGIAFPEPLGGGTVEVKQPMNFQPKKM